MFYYFLYSALTTMKKSVSTATSSSISIPESSQSTPKSKSNSCSFVLKLPARPDFISWYKRLSLEERYLAFHIKNKKLVKEIKYAFKRIEEDEIQSILKLSSAQEKSKGLPKIIKLLLDCLMFITTDDYLDTVAIDNNFLQSSERLYDLLLFKNEDQAFSPQDMDCEFENLETKENWAKKMIKLLRNNFLTKFSNLPSPQQLDPQKNNRKEFMNFWKILEESQKRKFVHLGSESLPQLLNTLSIHEVSLEPFQIEKQVKDLMKLEKLQAVQKIFKCKLKKSVSPVYDYYELLYERWKEGQEKRKRQPKKTVIRKRKNKKEKYRQIPSNSNGVTKTKQEKNSLQVLQNNICSAYETILNASSLFYYRRLLAFERVQAIFYIYNLPVKLFGSCANGIAIKNSDVDIAIDEKVLDSFAYYTESPYLRIVEALEFFYKIFQNLDWVVQKKLIKTAKIPIIKLTIDTNLPVTEDFIPEVYRQQLNREIYNGGLVNIDLTIQGENHLGIISTQAINGWLEQIPTLKGIIMILKNKLSKHNLNESYSQGLNTYSLMVMLVGFVYYSQLVEEKSISLVLDKFLKFYGWVFDETLFKIDIRDKKNVFQRKEEESKCADLEVCDPLNEGNVMTKNCYRFREIKELMKNISKSCFSWVSNEVEELEDEEKDSEEKVQQIVPQNRRRNQFLKEFT